MTHRGRSARRLCLVGATTALLACSGPGQLPPMTVQPATDGDGGALMPGADLAAVTCNPACGDHAVCAAGVCTPLPAHCPCPQGSYCDLGSNMCKLGCLGDQDCGGGTFCDTVKRSCAPGCRVDADCPTAESCRSHACVNQCPSCDDQNPCSVDTCTDGSCGHAPAAEGSACPDDGNGCTADVCRAGHCAHEAANEGAACPDDGTTCTSDTCKAGKCDHAPANEGAACPDTPCSMGSTCKVGACNHPPKSNGTSCGATEYDRCLDGACKTARGLCQVSGGFDTQVAYWKISGMSSLTYNKGICSCGNDSRTLTVDILTGPTTWQVLNTYGCTACSTQSEGSSSMVCW